MLDGIGTHLIPLFLERLLWSLKFRHLLVSWNFSKEVYPGYHNSSAAAWKPIKLKLLASSSNAIKSLLRPTMVQNFLLYRRWFYSLAIVSLTPSSVAFFRTAVSWRPARASSPARPSSSRSRWPPTSREPSRTPTASTASERWQQKLALVELF